MGCVSIFWKTWAFIGMGTFGAILVVAVATLALVSADLLKASRRPKP